MTVSYVINYGGFIGTDEEYTIEVPDDATEDEIDSMIQEDFEEQVVWNSSWERVNDDEED